MTAYTWLEQDKSKPGITINVVEGPMCQQYRWPHSTITSMDPWQAVGCTLPHMFNSISDYYRLYPEGM